MLHLVQAAVDRIRQDAKGAATLAEWIGDGGVPVSPELANKRADICAACPQNVAKVKKIEKAVAEAILRKEEVRNKMDLRTGNDHNLRMCATCGCYLKLKVWVPFKNLREEDFPENCWFWREMQPGFTSHEAPVPVQNAPVKMNGVDITVDRQRGMGDAILASSVASLLKTKGYKVGFWTTPGLRPMFRNHPDFECIETPSGMHVPLNGVFERDPSRAILDRRRCYLDAAKQSLMVYGIRIDDSELPRASLSATDEEMSDASIEMMAMPRPFIVISPGSDHYTNRDIPVSIWGDACQKMPGTPIWIGTRQGPKGVFNPEIKTMRRLMAFIAISDACVSADTGPMHVAIAMRKPTLVVEGPFLSSKMLHKDDNWMAINNGIDCIGCGDFKCTLENHKKDLCTKIHPDKIVNGLKLLMYGK